MFFSLLAYTLILKSYHKKKCVAVKTGDLVSHSVSPLFDMRFPWNFLCRHWIVGFTLCHVLVFVFDERVVHACLQWYFTLCICFERLFSMHKLTISTRSFDVKRKMANTVFELSLWLSNVQVIQCYNTDIRNAALCTFYSIPLT